MGSDSFFGESLSKREINSLPVAGTANLAFSDNLLGAETSLVEFSARAAVRAKRRALQ
jgi:hypothetical protein